MKKTCQFLLVTIALMSVVRSQAQSEWALDTNHSNLRFSISLMMLSEVDGTFKMKEATIKASKDDFSDATVTMVADVKSVDTDVDARDQHLRTADFFDAEKFPAITFKSRSVKKVADKRYKVEGDLTMHGITKPVALDAIANSGTHPVTKKTIAGFKITGTIKRLDFGISPATPPAMLSDEVAIVANAQFEKK
ncbi:YceI family protein [Terrimonas alba]|uniref:YceI family protein n=1 Tax=Terrimonas alba TaxID=3349636 RepID=UPI0035F33CC2